MQDLLADLLTQVKRPGFWRNAAGQIAIAYGSQMVTSVAEEAEQRAVEAGRQLDAINAAIAEGGEALRTLVVEAIGDGIYDAEVLGRAAVLGWHPPAPSPDTLGPETEYGPPETAGAAVDLPGDEPLRTPANGAPVGQPDVPPRMADGVLPKRSPGEYLAGIHAMVPVTGGYPVDEDEDAPGPEDAPFNRIEHIPAGSRDGADAD